MQNTHARRVRNMQYIWYNLAPARCTSCYLRLVGLYLVLLQSLQNSLFNDAKFAYVRETTFFCLVSSLSRQDELRFNFRGQIWLLVPTNWTALRALGPKGPEVGLVVR